MHFKSLLHVRDHVKVQGRAYDLLTYIALHTNMHTGEAFELTIERQAQRHQLTPEWTRILLNGVIATGELIVERSRGRHPNRYRFPLERCHACRGDDLNPEVELGVDINPKVPPPQPQTQPQTPAPSTPKSDPANPKVIEASTPRSEPIEPQKEVKELKEYKEGPTPNFAHARDKAETASPFWCAACGVAIPTCAHRGSAAEPPAPERISVEDRQALMAGLKPGLHPSPDPHEAPGRRGDPPLTREPLAERLALLRQQALQLAQQEAAGVGTG